MKGWLETDEFQEAVISLEVVSDQLPKVITNNHHWKWVIVSLHNALQGFMVLALTGTNGLNTLTEKCAKEWLASHDHGERTSPDRKLDSFLNLYKKIQSDDYMGIYNISVSYKPKLSQERNVKKLNALRNEFIHFVPQGWMLELGDLPQIVEDCLDIIYFLAFECGNVSWRDESLKKQTREYIDRARSSLTSIKEDYRLL
jgi:hypothetical protein